MSKKSGLGRGLDALIPGGEEQPAGNVIFIPIEDISPNPRQPRISFDPEEINELAASISAHGVLQPLIVTQSDQFGGYQLIAGQRRWMASRQAGLLTVPAIIRPVTEQERLEIALIENVQRTDLNPLEAAEAFRQLSEDFSLSHEEIAFRVGKNRATITNTLRLLKLPDEAKNCLLQNQISEGHARVLLSLPTPQAQSALLKTILDRNLNVRQAEELARKLIGERPKSKTSHTPTPEMTDLEKQLRSRLGTKVNLTRRGKGGTITIHFYSDEELDSLINIMLSE
ncbi:MAG: ParB/RepB/Spo0J family partition protein [Anaerolineales bacterium]|nr:ParB/RepB/Spo0J family partition protein [Anaerolineales bacterium]